MSAGSYTKTTIDDTLSEESNEFSRIKRRLKKLDINSDENSS